MFILNGTCSVLDMVAHVVADPGDVFLCPTPYYVRIFNDMFEKSLVEQIHVDLSDKVKKNQKSKIKPKIK